MNLLHRIISRRLHPYGNISYAQCGEDLIVAYIFSRLLKIDHPTYLDIGAHQPRRLSNTFYFYDGGGTGVCVEPDPTLHAVIQRERPRDVCLNVGIGTGAEPGKQDFYIRADRSLNSFSPPAAGAVITPGEEVQSVVPVSIVPVNEVLATHFKGAPNFFSLDTEGMDLNILRAADFARFRPEVICVETLDFTTQDKDPAITPYLQSVGYRVYADTFLNTIYLADNAWDRYLSIR